MDQSALSERVANNNGRIVQLELANKELANEFKNYRHEARNELHKLGQEIDHINYVRETRGKELDALRNTMEGLRDRIARIETEAQTVKGGALVVRWLWTCVGAIFLCILAWALGKYG